MWFKDWRIRTLFSTLEDMPLPLKVVTLVHLQVILMATLCKSGALKPSLTYTQAPFLSTLLTFYLVVNSREKLSEVASIDMNMNTFLFEPKKQIYELCLRDHILSLPTLLLFTQMPLELFCLRKTPDFP